MKTKFFIGMLAVSSLGFTACVNDSDSNDIVIPDEIDKEVIVSDIKYLGSFSFNAELGEKDSTDAESRTPSDINSDMRPTNVYRLDKVYMMGLTPEEGQAPSESQINKVVTLTYDLNKFQIAEHKLNNHTYKLYYRLKTSPTAPGFSRQGKVEISTDPQLKNPISINLSVFSLEDLKLTQIPLNKFGFGAVESEKLRGDILRYTSYHPQDDNLFRKGTSINEEETELSGRYAFLPEMPAKYDFLKDPAFAISNNLVSECEDRYFSGNEFLVASDGEKIYMLETIQVASNNGGYFLRRTYPNTEVTPLPATPSYLAFNRLTTVINASFIFMDEDKTTYFDKGSEAKTIANFKNQYGVDLSDLACPYATIDGVNTRFYINQHKVADNVANRGRLVLWAKDYKVKDVAGNIHTKYGKPSMKILYKHGIIEKAGYGIEGSSYSVAFKGNQNDTKGMNITFWVEVDGVKVKVEVPMHPQAGITFSKNVAHHIICYVPAKAFSEYVKELKAQKGNSRANGADEYATFTLSPDCISVR